MFHLYLGLAYLYVLWRFVIQLPVSTGWRILLVISRLFNAPWVSQVVARTNALNPDLILITGDLIDGTTTARRQDVAALSGLKAGLGAGQRTAPGAGSSRARLIISLHGCAVWQAAKTM